MASDIWLRTILIVRKETCCHHIGYSFRLTARVLLYAPSHRQDSTYHQQESHEIESGYPPTNESSKAKSPSEEVLPVFTESFLLVPSRLMLPWLVELPWSAFTVELGENGSGSVCRLLSPLGPVSMSIVSFTKAGFSSPSMWNVTCCSWTFLLDLEPSTVTSVEDFLKKTKTKTKTIYSQISL